MPKVPRPGKRTLYVEIPEGLGKVLDAKVASERRSLTTVVILALEQYLGTSPEEYGRPAGTPPADAPDPAPPPSPRSRRRKKP